MQIRRVLAAMAGIAMMGATGSPAKNPPPDRRISIASALHCGSRHAVVRLRFSPDGMQLAFVLNGWNLKDNKNHWHLLLASRDGQNLRELAREMGEVPNYLGTPARHLIPWSPDGQYLAVLSDPIRVVRVSDASACTIPWALALIGFVEGPSLVVTRFDVPEKQKVSLEYRGPDCELQSLVPLATEPYGTVLPGGSRMAFPSDKGFVITDTRGNVLQEIALDLRKIDKRARKNTGLRVESDSFTENGSVLCAGVPLDFPSSPVEGYCIDLATGTATGTRPNVRQGLGRPFDSAEQVSRVVWQLEGDPVRDAIQWVPDILFFGVRDHPAFLVWDYRAAARILQLGAFRGLNWSDRPVAITPKGDAFAMVLGDSVLFWDLGPRP